MRAAVHGPVVSPLTNSTPHVPGRELLEKDVVAMNSSFARSERRAPFGPGAVLSAGRAALVALALLGVGVGVTFGPDPASAQVLSSKKEVAILQTNFGKIVVEFYPDTAPKTVATFKKHLREGLYEGTTIHRIIPGVAIVGGDPFTRDADPSNDGSGGFGPPIPNEFSAGRKNVRGVLGAPRKVEAANPDQAWNGFQFYIALADLPALDASKHTVFGRVLEGMDIVDRIANAARDENNVPKERIEFKKAYLEAR